MRIDRYDHELCYTDYSVHMYVISLIFIDINFIEGIKKSRIP